jgi:GXWXG protein/Domain of unknown function (DUF4334)
MTKTASGHTLRDLERGATTAQAMEFFDSLPPVRIEEMLGAWVGGEIPTGHPMNGLLGPMGWHGKRFDGPDEVHPLVMEARDGGRYSLNPGVLPVPLLLRCRPLLNNTALQRAARALAPALRTRLPRARLRMLEYRGVLTATMCYDQLPIHDVFRKVDQDTVLGAMDLRGTPEPLVFFLRREA